MNTRSIHINKLTTFPCTVKLINADWEIMHGDPINMIENTKNSKEYFLSFCNKNNLDVCSFKKCTIECNEAYVFFEFITSCLEIHIRERPVGICIVIRKYILNTIKISIELERDVLNFK